MKFQVKKVLILKTTSKTMKKKIYLFSKLVLFSTLISLIFSCEKDLYEDAIQQNHDKQINIKQISLEQFNSKLIQMKHKPEIEGFMVSSNSNSFQSRALSGSEFEIITDDIKEITQGDYTSYTMYVKTPDTTNSIYNITIEEVNDNTSVFLTKYEPSNNWTITSTRNFEGNIITYRISGITNDPVVLASLLTEAFEGLQEGGNNGAGAGSGGSSTSNSYPYDCDGYVHSTTIITETKCGCGHDWQDFLSGDCTGCDGALPAFPNLSTNTVYECIPTNYNPTDGDTPNPGDTPGGGTNTGNNNTGDTSLTTIVDPIEEEKKTPCEELIENDSISDFNTKMTELKIKAGTQDFESAHAIYQNAVDGLIVGEEFTGQSNANGEGREVYLSLNSSITTNAINCVGFIHCHLDNGTTFKVFSLDDIIALALIAELSTRPTSEFAIYVTTNSGTLALKVNNKTMLSSKIDTMDLTYNQLEREFKKNVDMSKSYAEQKKGLVKFLNNMPLIGNPGIDVYEKAGSTWNKLSLSTNGNSITSTPCN